MSVHFVYRGHCCGPSEKYVRTFESDATVLEWFVNRWERLSEGHEDDLYEKWYRLEAELGVMPEGFEDVFATVHLRNIPVPRTVKELRDYLEGGILGHKKFLMEDHCLQVLVNDKNFDYAYYFFDNYYVAANPGKADFLLHQDWKLPEAAATQSATLEGVNLPATATLKPSGTGEGTLYAAFLTYYDWKGLTKGLPNIYVINGMRLPGLIPWLVERDNLERQKEMRILRSVLTGPEDSLEAAFKRVAGRPLAKIGYKFGRCGLGTLEEAKACLDEATEEESIGMWPQLDSQLNCTEHIAQASFHVATWGIDGRDKYYHQWIFFDDLWATANPILASGIITFASRWDVLS